MEQSNTARLERGQTFEGWAFTFCKAGFLALIFQRYAILALSVLAAGFYIAAYLHGVREWRCWVKPPWVIVFFLAVAAWQVYALFIHAR